MKTRTYAVITITLALAAIVIAGLATRFITLDRYPALGTYGVSIGTSTDYLSAELVCGTPIVSYQQAR